MTSADFISVLLFSRNQSHIFHWQTKSFAKHKALNEYYDGIVDLTDSLVETYQGTNGIVKGFRNDFNYVSGDAKVVDYFERLLKVVNANREVMSEATDIQNIIDEITALIKTTLYKLKHLS